MGSSTAAASLQRRLSADIQARLLGLVVLAAGVADVASAFRQPLHDRLSLVESLFTPPGVRLATGASALLGLGLILVGRAVMGRRQVGLWTAVTLLLASTAANVIGGLEFEEALVSLVLAMLLVGRRSLFVVRPGPARFHVVAKVAFYVAAVELGYGLLGFIMRSRDVVGSLTPVSAIEEIGARMIGLTGPLHIVGRLGHWFPASLTVLGVIGFGMILGTALAPVALRGGGSAPEREELASLIDRTDGDTIDPFILRRDKRYVFSPDRHAAVGYRYLHGVGYASGDPVGDPASFTGAIGAFLELCKSHGWRPAVVGARHDRLHLYESFGLRTVYIGDEALIDVDAFTLDGRAIRNVRQSMNHTIRAGVTTEVTREGDLDARMRRTLLRIAAAQRKEQPEYGFSMSHSDLLNGVHPDCKVIVARAADGTPIGFQRYVPCRGGRSLSLDRIRRMPGSVNGLNERMIVDLIVWARANGFEEVSLNFASFRSYLDGSEDLEPGKALEVWIIRKMEGRFGLQLDTLRRFNSKFRPRWCPRYVIYRSAFDIPGIGLAALSSEGFLPFDRKWRVEAPVPDDQPTAAET